MQMLLTLLILSALIGFSFWWSARDTEDNSVSPRTEEKTIVDTTILDPIQKAREAKEILESKGLSSLDLSEQGLVSVPEFVFAKTELESLDLSNNELTGALPGEIKNLQNLKSLNISGNKFTGVPAEIGQLKNLEILDLTNNLLTGLPYELGGLSSLKVLRLTGNHYSEADLAVIKKELAPSVVIETE